MYANAPAGRGSYTLLFLYKDDAHVNKKAEREGRRRK
jgi:hypothetical protein